MARRKKKGNADKITVSTLFTRRVRKSVNYNENIGETFSIADVESDSDFEFEQKAKQSSSSDDDMPLNSIKYKRKKVDRRELKINDKKRIGNKSICTDTNVKPSSFVNICSPDLSEGSDSLDEDVPLVESCILRKRFEAKTSFDSVAPDIPSMELDVTKKEENFSSFNDVTNMTNIKKIEIDTGNTSHRQQITDPDNAVVNNAGFSTFVKQFSRERSARIDNRKRKVINITVESSSEGTDENWEEVDEMKLERMPKKRLCKEVKTEIKEEEPEIADLEIKVGVDSIHKKKKRKTREEKMSLWIRQLAGRVQRETQILLHKCHLLFLLGNVLKDNGYCDGILLQNLCLSLIPAEYLQPVPERWDINHLRRFTNWFQKEIPSIDELSLYIDQEQTDLKNLKRIHIFVIMMRSLGFLARLIYSLQPCPPKVKKQKCSQDQITKSQQTKKGESRTHKKSETKSKQKLESETKSPYFLNQGISTLDTSSTGKEKVQKSNRKHPNVDYKEASTEPNTETDDDFIVKSNLKSSSNIRKKEKTRRHSEINKKMLGSSMNLTQDLASKGIDSWSEVYMETLRKWICIELSTESINSPKQCESVAIKPLQYVIGIDNHGKIKDVTCRYAEKWLTLNHKLRVDREWWAESINPYKPCEDTINTSEDAQLRQHLMEKDLPQTVSACKDHPLYALQRHLLKYQAFYPPDVVPVGYLKKEAIYPRDCVYELHTRETWMKKARSILPGEIPYKIVKGRPKWKDRHLNQEIKVPCFGIWQTERYVPPPVKEGKVTKNEYGNIELFQPSMLPEGAVHIPMTNMVKIARKLKIDHAPAMMGWDFHGGFSHPVFEGIVVAKEFEDVLVDAWNKEEEERERKEEEKREKAIYDNWKMLIKGLLIRARLKDKYSFEGDETELSKKSTKAKKKIKKPPSLHKNKEKCYSAAENREKKETEKEEDEACTNLCTSWPMNRL